jgi:hypothetical protein
MATKSNAVRLALFSFVFAALLALHECAYVYVYIYIYIYIYVFHAVMFNEILNLLSFSPNDRLYICFKFLVVGNN